MRHIQLQQMNRPVDFGPCYIALGHFDGLHRGHQALIKKLVTAAREAGLPSVLLSLYDPKRMVLSTEEEKACFLAESGLDVLLSLEENGELPSSGHAEWIAKELKPMLDIRALVCGEADAEDLQPCGLPLLPCPMVYGESGRIICRLDLLDRLQRGDLASYQDLAGRSYALLGPVVHGAALGRKVGQPTANLAVPEQKIKPPEGVYATLSRVAGGLHMGLTNIGRRPSVDDSSHITIETYLLDFDQDIYGQTELLELYFPVRGVMKFKGLEEVRAQVQKDICNVRAKLSAIYVEQKAGFDKKALV